MKKLTTEKLYFLISLENLVTMDLLRNWKSALDIQQNYLGLQIDRSSYRSKSRSLLAAQILSTLTYLPILIFIVLTEDLLWIVVPIIPYIFSSFLLIRMAHYTQSSFTNDINSLQDVLRTYGRKEYRSVDYFLNRPWAWFIKEVEWILSKLARRLLEAEAEEGTDSPLANGFRMEFKHCHATFVRFNLCYEDQGKWLKPKKEEPAPQTAKEAIETIVKK